MPLRLHEKLAGISNFVVRCAAITRARRVVNNETWVQVQYGLAVTFGTFKSAEDVKQLATLARIWAHTEDIKNV